MLDVKQLFRVLGVDDNGAEKEVLNLPSCLDLHDNLKVRSGSGRRHAYVILRSLYIRF